MLQTIPSKKVETPPRVTPADVKQEVEAVDREVEERLKNPPEDTEEDLTKITGSMSGPVIRAWITQKFDEKKCGFTFREENGQGKLSLTGNQILARHIYKLINEKSLVDFMWGLAEQTSPTVAEYRAKIRTDFDKSNLPQIDLRLRIRDQWGRIVPSKEYPWAGGVKALAEDEQAMDQALLVIGLAVGIKRYIGMREAMAALARHMDWESYLNSQEHYRMPRTIGTAIFKGLCQRNYLHRQMTQRQIAGAQAHTKGFELLEAGLTRLQELQKNPPKPEPDPQPLRPVAAAKPPEPVKTEPVVATKAEFTPEQIGSLQPLVDEAAKSQDSVKTYEEMVAEITTRLQSQRAAANGLQRGIDQLELELKASKAHFEKQMADIGDSEKDLAEAETVRQNEIFHLDEIKLKIKTILGT